MIELLQKLLNFQRVLLGKLTVLVVACFKSVWFIIGVAGAVIAWAIEVLVNLFQAVGTFIEAMNGTMDATGTLTFPSPIVAQLAYVNQAFPVELMLNWTYVIFVATGAAYTIRAIKAWIPTVS